MVIQLNKDIHQILLTLNNQDFMIKDISLYLIEIPEYQIRVDSLERFILNHLNNLAKKDLLKHKKKGMNHIYSFTENFYRQEFKLTKKPKRCKPSALSDTTLEKKEISLLEEEKLRFEIELDAAIAEISEYKNLKKRLIKLGKPLSICLSETLKKSNLLRAKISARESVLDLVKNAT